MSGTHYEITIEDRLEHALATIRARDNTIKRLGATNRALGAENARLKERIKSNDLGQLKRELEAEDEKKD